MPTAQKGHSTKGTPPVPVVEILHRAETPTALGNKFVEVTDNLNRAVNVYAGKNAFRIYQATTGEIGRNKLGTLQGMVKSARWKTVFRVTSEVGEKLEIIAFLASFAENITKAAPEFEAIATSNDSRASKCLHFTRLAHTIGARTAVGVFTSGVSTIYEVLKGWCLIGTLAGGNFGAASQQCVNILEDADFRVKAAGKTVADLAANSNPLLNVIEITLH
jgi:hypothetical protein